MMMKEAGGFKTKWHEVIGMDESNEVVESPASCKGNLGHKSDVLRVENHYFWNRNLGMPMGWLGPTRNRNRPGANVISTFAMKENLTTYIHMSILEKDRYV
jgi:hypothetical protein